MDTREQLLKVAGKLFAERGFDGVSVRDIVHEAKANLGAVTYHFGGKEQLFAAVIARKIEPLREIGKRVGEMEADPETRLRAVLLQSALHILHHDPSLKVFFAEVLQGGHRLPSEGINAIQERNRGVAVAIREGIGQGVFKECDVDAATWIFFGMIMPYVLHQPLIQPERRRGAYPAEFVEKMVDAALDIFFHGLKRESS